MSDDTIQSESISQLFLGKNFGFLATPMNDDSPHVTPVWVDLGNGYIIVNTDEGRLKERNISHYPPVAISVADHVNNPYKMVTIKRLVA